MLIYFRSDGLYLNIALPVTTGTRHAIVSWLPQHGAEELRKPSEDAVQVREPEAESL